MLQLHPDNPHYLLFRGKATALVGSGEHYGAVLNRDFDYVRYLDAVKADGFNQVRIFSGTYREVPGSFSIANNTLAPSATGFVCPWARSDTPGETLGGNKFDLRRYDPAYFARLKDFIAEAGARGVVVEFVFFCVLYDEALWHACPMWAGNNMNGVGDFESGRVRPWPYPYTLEGNDLLPIQLDFVRKIAGELREFDNVYYEIINEPYKTGPHLEWQHSVIGALVEAESSFPSRHLIAQNFGMKSVKISDPHPAVSIFNFHYSDAASALDNYHLNKVVAHDEDGSEGQTIAPYRKRAWAFMLSGGAIVSHLDYSFTVERPDGTSPIGGETPGSGGVELRRQLRILKEFIESYNFLRLRPDSSLVVGGVPEGASAHALSDPAKAYAIFLNGGAQAELELAIPAGRYRAEWINTHTGAAETLRAFDHTGGAKFLASPPYSEDIALRVRRE